MTVSDTMSAGVQLLGPDVVRAVLPDGRLLDLHRLALRDACRCAECRHPVSGQRLFESRDVVPWARVASAARTPGGLTLRWEDGHTSVFDDAWLAGEADAAGRGSLRDRTVTLWGAELATRLPAERWDDVTADDETLRRWLGAVAELGFAVLRGVPCEDGFVARAAELFGHVRTTNYGRTFDVMVKVDPTNLAYTASPLSLHTDNPYRDPVPTLQLLHCLASTVNGGKTVLSDGFRAAQLLSLRAPDRLALLAEWPVRFGYTDETAELTSEVPVVALDASATPVALHLNNRSKAVPVGPVEDVARWYEAYFELLSLLERPDAQLVFRLEPGDLLVFDNRRVLHGRTSFSGEGDRRLQGCYADIDGLLSTLAVLERKASV